MFFPILSETMTFEATLAKLEDVQAKLALKAEECSRILLKTSKIGSILIELVDKKIKDSATKELTKINAKLPELEHTLKLLRYRKCIADKSRIPAQIEHLAYISERIVNRYKDLV